MNNLQEICETLLNNADLTLSVNGDTGVIKLEFYPASYKDNGIVTFYCSNYSRLSYRKSADEEDLIFVGETHVTIIEKKSDIAKLYKEDGWLEYNQNLLNTVAKIETYGGGMLSIVCEKFSWKQENNPITQVL